MKKQLERLIAPAILFLVAAGLCAFGATIMSAAVTSNSPEAKARATIMLRTTAEPTPRPIPTADPELVAAWADVEKNAAETAKTGIQFVVGFVVILSGAVAFSASVYALALAGRSLKVTITLPATKAIPANKPTMIGSGDDPGVYNPRSDRWTVTGQKDKEGDIRLGELDAIKPANLAHALTSGLQGAPLNRARQAQLKYLFDQQAIAGSADETETQISTERTDE